MPKRKKRRDALLKIERMPTKMAALLLASTAVLAVAWASVKLAAVLLAAALA